VIHHLLRVLRLSAGDSVHLVDEEGRPFEGVLSVRDGEMGIDVGDEAIGARAAGSRARIILVQGLLKADRTELAVQKATECGVEEVRVAVLDRSVPRPGVPERKRRQERLTRVAMEAARQCSRASVPSVSLYPCLDEALAGLDEGLPRFVLAEEPGVPGLASLVPADAPGAILAVGVEGSFSPGERQRLEGVGFVPVSLGPRILKAETAAMVAVVIVQVAVGDMG
jgi:16S rRNA (uracil1498-N3)-methyltransferase